MWMGGKPRRGRPGRRCPTGCGHRSRRRRARRPARRRHRWGPRRISWRTALDRRVLDDVGDIDAETVAGASTSAVLDARHGLMAVTVGDDGPRLAAQDLLLM